MSATDRVNERNWRAVSAWSSAPRMNELEAVMWRAERHPGLSSTILALEILDRAPDWERLRAAHEWGSELVPRFRQRVVEPVIPVGPPEWRADPSFDLDYHLRRTVLPAPGDHAALLATVQAFAQSPLDRSRPLWESLLIEDLGEGRAAYALKSHHSLSDGIAGIQLLGGMHSRTRRASPGKPAPGAPATAANGHGPIGLTLDELAEAGRAIPGAAGRLLGPLSRAAAHPRETAAAGQRFLGSVRRMAAAPGVPSDLLRPRTGRVWRFETFEVDLPVLKAAGRAAGGSLNDAYLAGLLGGVARYHEQLGADVTDLPVALPVSLRRPGDPEGGNRISAIQIAGPATVRNPRERIAAIRALVLAGRAEPALDLAGLAAPVLSRLPSDVALLARRHVGVQADLSASNFPGLREKVYIAGALVERIYAFGPLPGSAVMATLVSHGDVCCVSLNCDGEAVTEPATLRACMEAAFAEVLSLS